MLKKVLTIGLAVGVGLATLHAVTAEAGWTYVRPPGMWWYYGSLDGCASIAQVRNPDIQQALLRCDIQLATIETLCENPNDNDVRPGEAATQVVVWSPIGQEQLEKGDKKKGKANVCVKVDETDLGPEILCVNRNWNVIAALTTEFTASCTTERCVGEDNPVTPDVNEACDTTAIQDTQVCACTLPGWHVEAVESGALQPCADPLNPDGCEPYECFRVVDGVTDFSQKCEFQ